MLYDGVDVISNTAVGNKKPIKIVSKRMRGIRRTAVAYSFILPNFLGFTVFTLVPLVFSLALSFMTWNGSSRVPMDFVGLANFARLVTAKTFWVAVGNTMIFTAITVPLTMAAALGMALLLNQKNMKLRGLFRTASFFPYVASLVAMAFVWKFLFKQDGPINAFLHSITGLDYRALPYWLTAEYLTLVTVALFSVWKGMGYYMVIYLAGIQGINTELYEAASIDGADTWKKFLNVTLPQLTSTTFFVLMILIINSFKVYDVFLNVFAGGDNQLTDTTRVLVYQIYNTAFRNLDFGYASAMSLVLFLIVLIITIVQFKGESKFTS
jgi:multiple sugar transport system permease protein